MANKTSRRYQPSSFDNVEDLEEYRAGGFHPVHLGDSLDGGRYQILHKLGYGGFSTVWLGRDQQLNGYVALKILMAECSGEDCSEVEILKHIHGSTSDHPGRQFVASLPTQFRFDGPNGSHLCLVSPVLGPSISILSREGPQGWFDGSVARKLALQASQGLAYLHSCGVVHGDLTTSNLLVQLSNFDFWSQEDIYAHFGKAKKDPVATMSSDCPGPSAPSYVVDSLNFAKINGQCLEESIVIIDFGQAFFFGNPPIDGVGTPLSYCAPEAILELKASAASDLWALACCIFEVRARYQLFSTIFGTSREVLLQMVKTLGRLPSPWWEDWKGRSLYFDEHGDPKERANGAPWAVPFPLKEVLEGVNKEMKDGFMDPENRGCEIEGGIWELSRTKLSPAEIAQMEDLLERLLKFAPEERLSANEACNHAWFHEEERH